MKVYFRILLMICLCLNPVMALAQQDDSDESTVVGVSHYHPFVDICVKDGKVASVAGGYSIEDWERVAEKLEISNISYKILGSAEEKLACLERKECDVAIGGISVVKDRESRVDFSHPTFESGVGVMVGENDNILPEFSDATKKTLEYLAVFIILCGHVLWLSERGKDAIHDDYFPGILESFWCTIATMTTVGYGDIAPKKWIGRCTATLVMFTGIGFFGVVVAQLSADFASHNAKFNISSYSDLKGLKIATKDGISKDILVGAGISPKVFPTIEETYESLKNGDIDAVVYDLPGLLSYVRENSDSGLIVLDQVFYKHNYAFAFPEGSDLREKVNRIMVANPEIKEKLYTKYF